jgi:(p)ppGpp synthase/HD superfamily hydrolase
MNIWDQDTYLKAWNFASAVHLGQTNPGGEIPYINHIGLVTMEASAAIAYDPNIADPNLFILCALLHDTIEDTATTYADIKNEFGQQVADGVLALSKNAELPTKKAQMDDSLYRIRQQPQEVWMVKLCDRITNLQPPPPYWTNARIVEYRDESLDILEQLGSANQFLATRLKLKIDNYGGCLSAPTLEG